MVKVKKNFEESMSELEKIVNKLETGDLSLDESLEQFTKGIDLYRYCNKVLNDVEGKIKVILKDDDNNLFEEELNDKF